MNTQMPTNPVLISVATLVKRLQETTNEHYANEQPGLIAPQICADIGTVFIRIYQHHLTTNRTFSLCFIMLDTGNIRMPLGLKAYDHYDAGCVLDVGCGIDLITSDGKMVAPTGTPTSYDPNYKEKGRRDIPRKTSQSTQVSYKRTRPDYNSYEYDDSPEAERARQSKFGRQMRD